MKDGYKIYRDGVLVKIGSGYYKPHIDESMVLCDDLTVDAEVIAHKRKQAAERTLERIATHARPLTQKYECAIAYLEHLANKPESLDDSERTDLAMFPEIYDEYYYTYDKVPWSPAELCQLIVEKHEQAKAATRSSASLREAKRRRLKIESEEILGDSLLIAALSSQ